MYIHNKHQYYIYIVTNPERTVLYTGVTNNLSQRLIEHWMNRGSPKSFAGKYYCYNLIYFEEFPYVYNAIAREKEIKGWRKEKKLKLIGNKESRLVFPESRSLWRLASKRNPDEVLNGWSLRGLLRRHHNTPSNKTSDCWQ